MTAPINPLTAEGLARLAQLKLRANVAAYPLEAFDVRRFGAYGAVRRSPADGGCGPRPGERKADTTEEAEAIRAQRWPCTHYGVDLSAPKGSRVVAPHDGWILYWGPANDPPFTGYGPWVILIAHDDISDPLWDRVKKQANEPLIADWHPTAQSARYSLIGHLDPMPGPSPRIPMSEKMFKPGNEKDWRHLKDGTQVMTFVPHDDRYIYTGDDIGRVSDRNHVHWELRTAPLGGKSHRIDPMETWRQYYKVPTPPGAKIAAPSGGGGGLALLAFLLLGGKKRKRRR